MSGGEFIKICHGEFIKDKRMSRISHKLTTQKAERVDASLRLYKMTFWVGL